jgi:hypothetical protein
MLPVVSFPKQVLTCRMCSPVTRLEQSLLHKNYSLKSVI